MPFAVTQITATGSSDPLSFSFPYRSTSDIVVKVDGVTKTATTHYTFPTTSSVQFTSGNVPTSGQVVEIRRATSQNTRLVDYVSGAILTESDLDTDSNQAFFMAQESIDIANDGLTLQSTGVFDGSSKRITNVADPTGAQDAATKAYTDSQVSSVATNASAAATSASAAATSATNSAASATSAASSATSASTDGAAQVTLAAAQVALATTQATNAAASATAAAASAASVTGGGPALDGGGTGETSVIRTNKNQISGNVSLTVPTGSNGMSAGPITITSGSSVTVSSGATWHIVGT